MDWENRAAVCPQPSDNLWINISIMFENAEWQVWLFGHDLSLAENIRQSCFPQ